MSTHTIVDAQLAKDQMEAINSANNSFRSLWKKYSDTCSPLTDHPPIQYPLTGRRSSTANSDSPIFVTVGLNPSLPKRRLVHETTSVLGTYSGTEANDEYWKRVVAADVFGHADSQYHKMFNPLITAREWTKIHIDLFAVRMTSQNTFKEKMTQSIKAGVSSNSYQFLKDQIDVFTKLLCQLNPSHVVVANSFATDMLINNVFNSSLRLHPIPYSGLMSSGRYRISSSCHSLSDVTVSACGQLSGGATSKPDRDRLFADVIRVVDGN